MTNLQKLKFSAPLLMLMAFTAFGQPHAEAWRGLPVTQENGQKIINYCAQQLHVSSRSKDSRLLACAYGYVLAIGGKKASDCDVKYKKDNKAAKACKDPGYKKGKLDPLNIRPGNGGGSSCTGSSCSPTPTGSGKNCDNKHCDLIALYINPFIKLLTLMVGLVVAASLIMGGVQYSASGGDPQKVSAAKSRISNTLLAFIAYAFMYAFLNFLIPGGIF